MPNNKMERFTQRARRVLSLAQDYAEQRHDSHISSEHMLVGLFREEGGIAGRVLHDLGVEEQYLQKLIDERAPAVESLTLTTADLSQSSKKILELAVDEARRLGHHYIGTEHLLLGLVRLPDGVAIDILKELRISPEEVRRITRRILQESPVQNPAPIEQASVVNRPSPDQPVHYVGTNSIYLVESLMKKMLDMVGEGKLTVEQANEMLATLQPGLKLNTGMQAWLTTLINQKEQRDTRRVQITVSNRDTNENIYTLTLSLAEALEKLDQLLLATVPDNKLESVAFESDSSPLHIDIHIVNDKDKPDE